MTKKEPITTAGDTPITKDFLVRFGVGNLALDCPEITLTQCISEAPKEIKGRGIIFLRGDTFQLRMYCDCDGYDPFAGLKRWASGKSGEIIPDKDYFALHAVDISGFHWKSNKILVDRHGKDGAVATSDFDLVTCRAEELAQTEPHLSMYFFQDIKIPFNQYIDTTSKAGDTVLQRQISLDQANFEVAGLKFCFTKMKDEEIETALAVDSAETSFPEALETRIEEALRYVTFKPIRCPIVDKSDCGVREVRVMPRLPMREPLFDEPVPSSPVNAVNYWRLFGQYLRHVITFTDKEEFHPLSAQLSDLIFLGPAPLHVIGLLVSVAVEGILRTEFGDAGKPKAALVDALTEVSKLVRRIKCVDERLKARLTGAVEQMKTVRARDQLLTLAENGVVSNEMVAAWTSLRNATTHAAVHLDPRDLQEFWTRCNTVYTLLNRLVFEAIDYSGNYRDYSVVGWPTAKFP